MDIPTTSPIRPVLSSQAAAGLALEDVLENISDAVIVFDRELRYQYLNREAEKIAGRTSAEVIGKAFVDCFPDLVGTRFHHSALRALQDQQPIHFEEYYPEYDNWSEIRLHPFSHGVTSYFTDVTARKKMQEAHQRIDDRLSLALQAAQMGTWDWDIEENRISWSDRMAELLGDRNSSFDGTYSGFLELLHPEDRVRVVEAVQQALASTGEYELVYRTAPFGSETRWIMARGRGFYDPEGRPVRMSGICLDVTDRIRMEHRLLQSQKMEAVGRLAGGVAHDFNNMLSVIGGYTSLLIQQPAELENPEEILHEIRKAADRASDLTRQLLAFSRQQVLQPRIVDLNREVSSMSRMLRRLIGEHICLETRLATSLGSIRVDPGQLHQVVLNLAVNARDAMPHGGRLTLVTEPAEYAPAESGLAGKRYICLRVSDTGCGMTPEVQSSIFEPFYTTKGEGKGTGLGLATVYGIVNQSGGVIRVHSEPGRGSTFEVYLPVCDEQPDAPVEAEAPVQPGCETILLAEDEELLRNLIRDALKSYGYHVLEAAGGAEALELCRTVETIDLLLTDVVMPGMSGPELAKEFRRLRPSSRILFMTGYTDDTVLHHGVRNEGIPLLQKPFTIKTLALQLREVLASPVNPPG